MAPLLNVDEDEDRELYSVLYVCGQGAAFWVMRPEKAETNIIYYIISHVVYVIYDIIIHSDIYADVNVFVFEIKYKICVQAAGGVASELWG